MPKIQWCSSCSSNFLTKTTKKSKTPTTAPEGQQLKVQATGELDVDTESPFTLTLGRDGQKLAKSVDDPIELDESPPPDRSGPDLSKDTPSAEDLGRAEESRRSARIRKSMDRLINDAERHELLRGSNKELLDNESQTKDTEYEKNDEDWEQGDESEEQYLDELSTRYEGSDVPISHTTGGLTSSTV